MDSNHSFNLIVKNAMICTMDREGRVLRRGSLAVRGDRIALISETDLSRSALAERVIDAGLSRCAVTGYKDFLRSALSPICSQGLPIATVARLCRPGNINCARRVSGKRPKPAT